MLWLKAFHLIGIILWMGGLFQLSRHLGMTAEFEPADRTAALKDYESKTYYMATLPGLVLTLGTGLWLFFANGAGTYLTGDNWGGTFHMKLLLVVILLGIDQFVHFKMRKLHDDEEVGRGAFMAAHGITGLIFILIVVAMKTGILV